ncbi:unnamed protein product [Oreochromis niloticus]|nr:unnamed protein product [Mustela putorius furo]
MPKHAPTDASTQHSQDCTAHAVMRAGGDITVSAAGAVEMIDTYDRPGTAFTEETFARAETFADAFQNKPGKRLPKAGAYVEAGVGYARAEWSVFDAEAKGPNASAGAEASVASGAQAFARAEIASASASAGPVKATVGLGLDTGVGITPIGFEAKVLGTGFSIGPKTGISLFGSGFEIDLCELCSIL